MKKISMFIIFLTIFFTACLLDKSPLQELEFGLGTDYDIYRIVLNNQNHGNPPTYVLSDSTVFWQILDTGQYFHEHMPSLLDETLEHYQKINRTTIQLKNIPDLTVTCYLIPQSDQNNWKTRYPDANALIHLSRVGYDSAKKQALVYLSVYFAPLAGSGNMILLEKDPDWHIVTTVMVWIS